MRLAEDKKNRCRHKTLTQQPFHIYSLCSSSPSKLRIHVTFITMANFSQHRPVTLQVNKSIWPGCDLSYGMKQPRKAFVGWPGMKANFHYKHSLNENNHLDFFFRLVRWHETITVMLFRVLLPEHSVGHSKSRKQTIRNTRNEVFAYFYL